MDSLGAYCTGYNSMPKASYQGDEILARISGSLKGREFTAEHRTNLSVANRERMLKDPRRFALVEFASHPGETNPFFGKHHSDEVKRLISLKIKGTLPVATFEKLERITPRGRIIPSMVNDLSMSRMVSSPVKFQRTQSVIS